MKYMGYTVTFKYLLEETQMQQVLDALSNLRLVLKAVPIGIAESPLLEPVPPTTPEEYEHFQDLESGA
jgi:hypothetical protein